MMELPQVTLPESAKTKVKEPTIICACGHAKGYHEPWGPAMRCTSGRGRSTGVRCPCKVPRGVFVAPDARCFMFGQNHAGLHPLFLGIGKTQEVGKGDRFQLLIEWVCDADGCDAQATTAFTDPETGETEITCKEHIR